MVNFYGLEEHIITFMKRPEQNVCTDGLLGGKPHPRAFGLFPRVLGKYVREHKVLSLEKAIYKMTGKPAEVFGLAGRGFLKKGCFADVVIFNPDTVIDKGTFIEPDQYSVGIEYVLVNWKIVIAKGAHTGTVTGRVKKRNKQDL